MSYPFFDFSGLPLPEPAQMLNFSDLARDADVAPNTAKTWLSILQASGIIYLLEPYYTNLTKRLVRSPKLYFLDTGLCAYLTEWTSPETLEAGAMSGSILESWIVSELLKSYRHNGHIPPFYYYRDRDGKEIDLLILRDGTIYPIEIKKTASPTKNHVPAFPRTKKNKHTHRTGRCHLLIRTIFTTHRNCHVDSRIHPLMDSGQAQRRCPYINGQTLQQEHL